MEASEKRKAQMREYRRTHKEEYNARQRKFYQNHKDYYKKYQEKPYKEIERLNDNWQRLDDYLQRMLKVSVGEYKKAIQETIYMVNMLKEIKENNNG